MNSKILILNSVLLIFILGANLYLTLLSQSDEKLLLSEKHFALTDILLSDNRRRRRNFLMETIFYSLALLFNTMSFKVDLLSIVVEISIVLYCIIKIKQLIHLLNNSTEVQSRLIVEWVFDLMDEVRKEVGTREEQEKLLNDKITQMLHKRNLSAKKFNKVMRELDKEFDRIQEKEKIK